MRLLLFPHGGSGNHGCEAIVRSTAALTGADVLLASSAPGQDHEYGLDRVCSVFSDRRPLRRLSAGYLRAAFRRHVLACPDAYDIQAFGPLFEAAARCSSAFSVGGDNYCYGEHRFLYLIDRELRKRGMETVLWGCSLNPGSLKGEMLEDLRGFDRIIARECLTYNLLKAGGFRHLEMYPDPAFALERKPAVLPDGFVEGNTVGINLSPLLMSCGRDGELVYRNFEELVRRIITETDMHVALIPHVVWPHSDDRGPLRRLYDAFGASGRVVMVDDRPCAELKDIIARCRFMVAARTHASIAAYSSCVPTLVTGYSTKAEGIATDLFGTDRGYVLPVRTLSGAFDLAESFSALMMREKEVRNHLNAFIPDYTGRLEALHP